MKLLISSIIIFIIKKFWYQKNFEFSKKNPELLKINSNLKRNFYPEISWWKNEKN